MGIVEDIITRQQALASARIDWESAWQEAIDYVMPVAARMQPNAEPFDWITEGPRSRERVREIYDGTAIWLVDRLAAGMESLTSPQSEKWHGLDLDDPFGGEIDSESEEWLERLCDYQFRVRYDPRAGFLLANQKLIRSMIVLGTAVMALEEARGRGGVPPSALPALYRTLPLSQCFLSADDYDTVDTNYRRFTRSARNAVATFGEANLSPKLREAAGDDKRKDTRFEFIHGVFPRAERGSRNNTSRNAPWASFLVEVAERRLVRESGFYEFPFVVTHWNQQEDSPYGEGPVMLAISDIRSLQVMAMHEMIAGQQAVLPPLAVADDGVMNAPDLNPNAVNYGAVDENGRLRIQPIVTATNLPFGEQVLEAKRQGLRTSMYVDLFQILIENPQMTATEALIRANEKGELLGPAGAKIQYGYARMVDRELAIYGRAGAFGRGAAFEPPEALQGGSLGIKLKSPLDRLRRSGELIGVERMIAVAGQLAAIGKPGALDKLDEDEIMDLYQEIGGAPRRSLLSDDELRFKREMQDRMRQEQMALGAAGQLAEIGEKGVPALAGLREMAAG